MCNRWDIVGRCENVSLLDLGDFVNFGPLHFGIDSWRLAATINAFSAPTAHRVSSTKIIETKLIMSKTENLNAVLDNKNLPWVLTKIWSIAGEQKF